MAQFIMLTRISAQSLHQPKSFETLERHAAEQVAKACPEAKCSYGHAHTEVWPALPWAEFKKMVHDLPGPA